MLALERNGQSRLDGIYEMTAGPGEEVTEVPPCSAELAERRGLGDAEARTPSMAR